MSHANSTERTVRFYIEDRALGDVESANEESLPARSPPPPTPSPTHSVSTVSSTGPWTPPSPGFMVLESKGHSPLPSSTVTPKIHPCLSSGSIISWDMSKSPDTVPGLMHEGDDPAASGPAGPLTCLMLRNDAIPDWPVYVEAGVQATALTVMEVLHALYEHLSSDVEGEYYRGKSQEVQKAVSKAFKRRDKPQGTGLQRIDFLPGRQFHGLRAKPDSEINSNGVWEFRFDVG
ncbi:hypothetical protein GALMADRAFT_896776 [Galerina marginata CBS 339.88]|uniref:DUF6699 domain-containing protein n=1 Tax=Galerina marginata (strain CBS 339.88) TaxID=685588 RepID=A0A067ST12_GALM3|nr:hypothetical protein GALMADRAFT_896776 [Galerina marginata CBS 339.88]